MPSPTYDLIASNVLGSSAASVTFSSIPATYRDLILVMEGQTTQKVYLRINGDTGANYSNVEMTGSGSLAESGTDSNQTNAYLDYNLNLSGTQAILQFMDYSATDKHKTILLRANRASTGTSAAALRWASTSAITSFILNVQSGGTFATGSTFYLYGIAS